MYKRFEKIEKDDDGNLYVPWFEEVRFYFNNADLQNSDLQNPVFKPNSRITKVRVIGKEPKKAAFALMPKKITVENKDFETNQPVKTVYTLTYDAQNRISAVKFARIFCRDAKNNDRRFDRTIEIEY